MNRFQEERRGEDAYAHRFSTGVDHYRESRDFQAGWLRAEQEERERDREEQERREEERREQARQREREAFYQAQLEGELEDNMEES